MITKNITKYLIACSLFCGGVAVTSCSDMLETDSNRQVFDPALDQKTDSMFYTLGILKGLQLLADQYVMTGEMRGDLTATNMYTETDLKRLANFTADATNKYDSAYVYYRVINNCNYYLAHRDTTLATGSQNVVCNEYAAVASFRAWTYLQLARQYGAVPYITDPVTTIGQINANTTMWSPYMNNFVLTDWAIEDASFLRLNTLTLGYTVPKKITSLAGISSLRFYATAYNVFCITGYSGSDPEADCIRKNNLTPSVDYSGYPRSRSFVFGLNLNF